MTWLAAERTVLRRSLETSVEVDSEETVDNFEESLNRMREALDLAGGKSEVAPTSSSVCPCKSVCSL